MDAFKLTEFTSPDFSGIPFTDAPEAKLEPAPFDTVAPDYYHAMSIFPEYFLIGGRWLLAEESRMDCVAVFEERRIHVREFRHLRKGDMVIVGRTEKAEEGIFVHSRGFCPGTRRLLKRSLSGRGVQGKQPIPWIMIFSIIC